MNRVDRAPLPTLQEDLRHLTGFGFVVLDGDHPAHAPGPRLLIELRDAPTLAHFDPETVVAWTTRDGRGVHAQIDRHHVPARLDFGWGTIKIYDRLKESNAFVTFGGVMNPWSSRPSGQSSASPRQRQSCVGRATASPSMRWPPTSSHSSRG